MNLFFLRPLDVLRFGDGRAFDLGENHRAEGVFPPPPPQLYGALRSALLSQAGAALTPQAAKAGPAFQGISADVADAVGTREEDGNLRIALTALAAEDAAGAVTPLWPTPADVLRPKDGGPDAATTLLRPHRFDDLGVQTDLPVTPALPWADEEGFWQPAGGFVDAEGLTAYLAGQPPQPYRHPDVSAETMGTHGLFAEEPRTHVALDPQRRTARESMLFTMSYTRPRRGVGLLLGLEHAGPLAEQGLLRLGAEGRAAAYRPAEAALPDAAPVREAVAASGRFKIVLMTPAPFERGWLPDFLNEDGTGSLGGCRVRLLSAAVGRHGHLGGWDLARRRPRQARRTVPAGSVYAFELEEGDAGSLFDAAFGRSLLRLEADQRRGLGLAYLAAL